MSERPHPASKPSGLGVIFLTIFIDLLGFTIIFPLFPALLDYYLRVDGNHGIFGALVAGIDYLGKHAGGTSDYREVLFGGIVISLYAFLQFYFSPLWGALSDRIGRRSVLRLTIAGTAVSYLLWFFSGSFLLFVASRLLAGAFAGNLSVATAAVADVTTRENRTKGMAIIGVAFGLGFLVGPAIGSLAAMLDLTASHPHWSAFGVNPFSAAALLSLVFSVTNLIWVNLRFHETLDPQHREEAVRVRHPLHELIASDNGPARRTNWLYFIYQLAFAGMESALPFLANRRFGFGAVEMAKIFVFLGLVLLLTQGAIVRRAVPRFGEKPVLLAGMAFILIGMLGLALAQSQSGLYAGLAALGIGSGLTNPSVSSLVSLYSTRQQQGRMLGIFRSLGSLARGLGPLAACFIFWRFGPSAPFFIAAAVMLIPWFMALPLPRPAK
ncbi:MAG TPA: MFS transporter [Opitutaceae bacterium]|jgi:MFS family permease